MHMYFYAYTLVLISNFLLIQSFSLCSSLKVPANDFAFSPELIQSCKLWHSFTCWKDETSVRLETSKFRKNQRVSLKLIMWPSCPIRIDINPSNKLPMNREGKRTIYFNDFTAGLTQYIHLKAKNEMQVIQERTCYESLTKKHICNRESQIAKFLHEAACFRFKSYMGPKLLNGPLM